MRQFLLLLLSISCTAAFGQRYQEDTAGARKPYNAELSLAAFATSNDQVPFWMRANQFGSIPLDGTSASVIGKLSKSYNYDGTKRLVDWGFGLDLRLNAGKDFEFIPVEAYVKGRIGIFQLKAGRSKDISGLVDSTLSTGSYAISGNALGIPKVELSVPEFWNVPFLGKIVAFKGSFSHGWMGNSPIQYGEFNGSSVETYFHNASLHGRFGKAEWPVKFYGGINHEVIWGSDKLIFGDQYSLTGADAFWHVITGKKYVKDGLKRDISKIGNHLGAIDLGLELETENLKFFGYRQQFYDKGALAYLANAEDGLTGLSITNKRQSDSPWQWQKFLLEVFYSKGQAGKENAKETPSGAEYYYNHAVYTEGYSYRGLGLGNPLITSARVARRDLPNDPLNYFINNRVVAFHFGTQGILQNWSYQVKLTYSQNFGEYRASDIPYWYNGDRYDRVPEYGIFPKVNQFSGFLEVSRPLKNGLFLGVTLAGDQGKLLYNSFGGSVKVFKRW